MNHLLTLHPVTETTAVAACQVCHRISRTPAAGRAHVAAAHPRRAALAQERRNGSA